MKKQMDYSLSLLLPTEEKELQNRIKKLQEKTRELKNSIVYLEKRWEINNQNIPENISMGMF